MILSGIKSETTLDSALKRLEAVGLIGIEKRLDKNGGCVESEYILYPPESEQPLKQRASNQQTSSGRINGWDYIRSEAETQE